MTPVGLLDELRSLGVAVTANRGRLHVKVPVGVLTPELRADLKQHKPELLALLDREGGEQPVQTGECNLADQPGVVVESGRLSTLLAKQSVVRVRSRLLGEVVVWAADEAEVPTDCSEVVYRESELRRLVGKSPSQVRAVHELKRALDAEVIE